MKKPFVHTPSRPSRLFLRIALALILIVSVALTISYLDARKEWAAMANLAYRPLLEYVLAAISIAAAGVLLIEIAQRDLDRK